MKDNNPVALVMWTIYDHPSDYPSGYIARMFEVTAAGPRPTFNVITSPSLESLRRKFEEKGLIRTPRDEMDDPVVLETWL